MNQSAVEDERLTRVTEIALALPGAERETMGTHAGFKVKKKVFAYFLNDHHGDGIVGIWCKVLPGENAALIAANPKRFYMPAYVGPRGWVGLRLDVGRVSWKEVGELVGMSYSLVAGKKAKQIQRF
jgi:predicted DNA-binding protein (MmcQ/YjbR family)